MGKFFDGSKKVVTGAAGRALFAVLIAAFMIPMRLCAVPDIPSDKIKGEDIIAYDPAEGKFVYSAMSGNIKRSGLDVSGFRGKRIRASKDGMTDISEYSLSEGDVDALAAKLHKSVDRTSLKRSRLNTRKLKENVYRLELSDKADGQWYRFQMDVPHGSVVEKIIRDDGVEITNDLVPDGTGNYILKNRFYRDGDKLYFYDDPINGYSVVLYPASPSFSMLIEEASAAGGGCGQISCIMYPYNGETNLENYTAIDHLGRSGDNGIGRNVSYDGGNKMAFRYQSPADGNFYQYGNTGATENSYPAVRGRAFTHVSQNYNHMNTTPWGQTEATITTVFDTTQDTPEIRFTITKKTILRGNMKWFATIFYIANTGVNGLTATAIDFFNCSDFDFDGDPNNDSCAYDPANDTVFGYKPGGNPIAYMGFASPALSVKHDVNAWNLMWGEVQNAALNNSNLYNGDASVATEYSLGTMAPGQQKVQEVVWGFGNTQNAQGQVDMQSEINYGLTQLHDVGISAISAPASGATFQTTQGYIMITATVVDYGLRDWTALPVHVKITGPSGYLYNGNMAAVNLSIPGAESVVTGLQWNIGALAAGTYTINVYTDLTTDMGVTDQNPSNNQQTITVNIGGITLSPQTSQTVNINATGNINLTATNTGASEIFYISLSAGAVNYGWPTYIINTANGVTIASDTNGDQTWDYINPAYLVNGQPAITVNNGASYPITFRQSVPGTATGSQDNSTIVNLTGSVTGAAASAQEDTLTPANTSVNKTLWLHGSIQAPASIAYSLTTITDTAAANTYDQLQKFDNKFFALSPALYRNLNITGNILVNLSMSDNGQTTCSPDVLLFATNGSNTISIGEQRVAALAAIADAAPAMTQFTFPVAGSLNIPAGYYLELQFRNDSLTANTPRYIRLYHDKQTTTTDQRSNISLSVSTYIAVDSAYTYDSSGNSRTVFGPGNQVTFGAQVSDPFGAYDVTNTAITVFDPTGTTRQAATFMVNDATDTGNPSGWRHYNNNSYSVPAVPVYGVWSALLTAYERNGVTSTRVCYFIVAAPDHIRVLPVSAALPINNNILLNAQVVDINGNSIASAVWVTITANNNGAFTSIPGGWTLVGQTAYGLTNAFGYADLTLTSSVAQTVTITPDSLLTGSQALPDRDEKAYILFTTATHAVVYNTDGIAAAGMAGTGEALNLWLLDTSGNTVATQQYVTITAGGNAVFTTVPAGWSGVNTGAVYGQTSVLGTAAFVLKDNTVETVTVTPNSGLWGNHGLDISTQVKFVSAGADHVVLVGPGGSVTAGTPQTINISVVDADGIVVPGTYNITITSPAKATFTAATLGGVTGIGTGTISGMTAASGLASATIMDYYAQAITVTVSSLLPGSQATPDRDVNAPLKWTAGAADHTVTYAASRFTIIGTTDVITVQIVDLYGNSVAGAQSINVSTTGASIFTATTLGSPAGLLSLSVTGTTNASGSATLTLYNETAQTNTIMGHSVAFTNTAADVSSLVTFMASFPTPTSTFTFTPTFTNTYTFTRTPTYTPTFTVTPSFTMTGTYTVTQSITPTITPTYTATKTVTRTITPSVTQTATPTITPTYTVTQTATQTITPTITPTYTNTRTVTQTVTPTYTWTLSSTLTQTPTYTWTLSSTLTKTPTYTWTLSSTLTQTPTYTWTLSSTLTQTPTYTWTLSSTLTQTPTYTWTLSSTLTKTPTYTWTLSSTLTQTPTYTWTLSSTLTQTPTYTWTLSSTLTQTPTYTWTLSSTLTKTPTYTWTLSSTLTQTPTYTWTLSSTLTQTPTYTWTLSSTLTQTPTYTWTLSSTQTQTPTYTWTLSSTLTQAPTYTWTLSSTLTKTPTYTWTLSSTLTQTPTYTWTLSSTLTQTPTYTWTLSSTLTQTPTYTWTLSSTLTQTPTYTWTLSSTQTQTPTYTWTLSSTQTQTPTYTWTLSSTLTQTPTYTWTLSSTLTQTPTYTWTLSSTQTQTPTYTWTLSSTLTQTPTYTWTLSSTQTQTPTYTWTLSSTLTQTPTYTLTLSSTLTLTPTYTWTLSSTLTQTPTYTWTLSSTLTSTPTYTWTQSSTLTQTQSFTPSVTQTITQTATPSVTPTATGTITQTFTFIYTPTITLTMTESPTFTATSTPTYTWTLTFTLTSTPTWTQSATMTYAPTFTETLSFTPSYTYTVSSTFTVTLTYTSTYTATPTSTYTSTSTYTPTSSNTQTITQTFTVTETATLTATPYGKNRVQVSIYDANGATVATLLPGGSDLIIHDFTYSANPFTDNGVNILNIYDSNGHSFAQWDGRNFGRTTVPSGIYMVHVVTMDPDGNSYVVDLPLDIIAVGSDGVTGFSIRDLGAEYVIQSQVTNVDWIKIRIYNLNGELIKGFEVVPSSGQFSVSWNKRTTSGARAANGIYVVVIEFKDSGTGYLDRRIEKLFLK